MSCRLPLTLCLVPLVPLFACGDAQPGQIPYPPELIDTTASALNPFARYTLTGSGLVEGPDYNSHYCFLSEFAGGATDALGSVQVIRTPSSRWGLIGMGGFSLSEVRAEMNCVPRTHFSGPSHWASGSEIIAAGAGARTLWRGDAFSAISGVYGQFRTSCDRVDIYQAASYYSFSNVSASSCTGMTQGFGQSFFTGTPGNGDRAAFYGPLYVNPSAQGTGAADETLEYLAEASPESSYHSVRMARLDLAACYFTEIKGEFKNLNQGVRIFASGDYWYLRARTTYNTGGNVQVRARCAKFTQPYVQIYRGE